MSSKQTWRIIFKNLEAHARVGIHPHEREAQRLLVNAAIDASCLPQPKTIADCFNYEPVYQRVVKEWPARPHTDLLETLVIDLLKHIFSTDARVCRARVSVAKPDIFPQAESVGVEAEWTRAEYEQLSRKP